MGVEWLHLEMVYDMHCWYNNVPICTFGIECYAGGRCVCEYVIKWKCIDNLQGG